jgi:hypothetical protein
MAGCWPDDVKMHSAKQDSLVGDDTAQGTRTRHHKTTTHMPQFCNNRDLNLERTVRTRSPAQSPFHGLFLIFGMDISCTSIPALRVPDRP